MVTVIGIIRIILILKNIYNKKSWFRVIFTIVNPFTHVSTQEWNDQFIPFLKVVCCLYRWRPKNVFRLAHWPWKVAFFALALRQEFDAQKSISDPKERAKALLAGQYLLYKYRHLSRTFVSANTKIWALLFNTNYLLLILLDPSAPGGAAYDRETRLPQKVQNLHIKWFIYSFGCLDYWSRKWWR